jgi:hypothetical protein
VVRVGLSKAGRLATARFSRSVIVYRPPRVALWYNRSRMANKTTLESLANLVTKGFASADKKFAALAEDIAAVEKRLDQD